MLDDIKRISIKGYLQQMGIYPKRENDRRGMYSSPLRTDTNASFSVDYAKNVWLDHRLGEGGSIIDLVSKLEHCSVGEAAKKLESDSFSFRRNNDYGFANPAKQESVIRITDVRSLINPALLTYLDKRSISTDVAKAYCVEIHYSVNEKPYFAIGFKNDYGGYDLRNKYFQGCISPKEITHIKQKDVSDSCYVFEGFIDYLSFLVLRKRHNPQSPNINKQNYLILNSVSNTSKALTRLGNYKHIHCFLDNDEAGLRALQKIRQKYGLRVVDSSKGYAKHKDLNDYLCERSGKMENRQTQPHSPARIPVIKIASKGRKL